MASGVPGETSDEPGEYSFDELSSAWLSARESERLAKKTRDNYKYAIQRLEQFFDEFGLDHRDIDKGSALVVPLASLEEDGEQKASELDGRHLLDYFLLWLRDDAGYADSTVKTTYFALKPFLDHLYREGHVSVHSTDDFTITKYVSYSKTKQSQHLKLKRKAINEEEHELLMENVGSPSYRNSLILQTMWECGLRREEIAALTFNCFDLKKTGDEDDPTYKIQERRIDVPPVKWRRSEEKPEPRTVFFSESLKTNFNIWFNVKRKTYSDYEEYDAVFLADHGPNKGPIVDDRVNKIVKDAAENAGIQEVLYPDQSGQNRSRITAHSYRHGYAFKCIENGMDIYTLKETMGHHSVKVTEQYLDSKDEYIKQQMDRYRPS